MPSAAAKQCSQCQAATSRYNCPKCGESTCSLVCSRQHRDKVHQDDKGTAAVPTGTPTATTSTKRIDSLTTHLSRELQLPPSKRPRTADDLLRDATFVNSIARISSEIGQHVSRSNWEQFEKVLHPTPSAAAAAAGAQGGANGRKPPHTPRLTTGQAKREMLAKQIHWKRLSIMLLPDGMQMRKDNSTMWQSREQKFVFTVDVRFPLEQLDSSAQPTKPTRILLHRIDAGKSVHRLFHNEILVRARRAKEQEQGTATNQTVMQKGKGKKSQKRKAQAVDGGADEEAGSAPSVATTSGQAKSEETIPASIYARLGLSPETALDEREEGQLLPKDAVVVVGVHMDRLKNETSHKFLQWWQHKGSLQPDAEVRNDEDAATGVNATTPGFAQHPVEPAQGTSSLKYTGPPPPTAPFEYSGPPPSAIPTGPRANAGPLRGNGRGRGRGSGRGRGRGGGSFSSNAQPYSNVNVDSLYDVTNSDQFAPQGYSMATTQPSQLQLHNTWQQPVQSPQQLATSAQHPVVAASPTALSQAFGAGMLGQLSKQLGVSSSSLPSPTAPAAATASSLVSTPQVPSAPPSPAKQQVEALRHLVIIPDANVTVQGMLQRLPRGWAVVEYAQVELWSKIKLDEQVHKGAVQLLKLREEGELDAAGSKEAEADEGEKKNEADHRAEPSDAKKAKFAQPNPKASAHAPPLQPQARAEPEISTTLDSIQRAAQLLAAQRAKATAANHLARSAAPVKPSTLASNVLMGLSAYNSDSDSSEAEAEGEAGRVEADLTPQQVLARAELLSAIAAYQSREPEQEVHAAAEEEEDMEQCRGVGLADFARALGFAPPQSIQDEAQEAHEETLAMLPSSTGAMFEEEEEEVDWGDEDE